jgi:hypothetical protein
MPHPSSLAEARQFIAEVYSKALALEEWQRNLAERQQNV